MKQSSFLLGAAVLMLATACSNDEVVSVAPQGGAISFNSFIDHSTRADNTYADVNDLKVWGVTSRAGVIDPAEIFNGEIVSKNGAVEGTGVWTYSPVRYWIAGNAYSFAAIAPASAVYNAEEADNNGSVTVSQDLTGEWSEAGLTLTLDNEKAAADLDLLYATNGVDNAAADNDAVALVLKHMLSRVKFEFDNKLPSGEIKIANLQINNAVAKASISKAEATGKWTASTEANNTLVVKYCAGGTVYTETTTEAGDIVVNSDPKYLIPVVGGSNYNVTFTIQLFENGNMIASYDHNVTIGELQYENNYSYNFKATIDRTTIDPNNDELKPIDFTVSVDPWTDWTPGQDESDEMTLPKNETEGE